LNNGIAPATLAMAFKSGNREIRVVATVLIHCLTTVITDKLGTICTAASRTIITNVIVIIQ
jgi:hypothetical protein